MLTMDWVDVVKELGPYLGVIFFFIYRDYRREERLFKEIKKKDEFIIKLIKENRAPSS